jgi:hypothetical protein
MGDHLFANGHRAAMIARCRELLDVLPTPAEGKDNDQEARRGATKEAPACPCCGGPMKIIGKRRLSPTLRVG